MPRSIAVLVAVLATLLSFASATAAPDTHGADSHGDTHHADGHGGAASPLPKPKEALGPAITAIVVFGIVSFVLGTKVWPMITSGLDERNAKIREEIASAEAAQKQARAALEEYEKSLAEARLEAQRMLDEARTQQAVITAELKAKADRELTEMREKAKREIESAKKAALGEIYAESVNLATQMAGKILQREVTVADQERMLEESLGELTSAS